MNKIICGVQDGDERWVEEFENDLHHLCGVIIECFEENKQMLLSPVCRDLVLQHAKRVQEKLNKIHRRLHVDNLGPYNLYGIEV